MSDTSLEPGAAAPDFTLRRDGGETVSLSDFGGKPLVLFFYPKADTSGCTKEAVAFSELGSDFSAAGAAVVGISKDPVEKQEKFRDKHNLTVPLLSDDQDVCERYGTWVEKSMYGKKFMGIERTTFLIGPDGRIAKVWSKVKVPGHAEEVLDAVRAL